MKVLSDKLATLNTREQLMVVGGAIMAVAILVYSAAWRPWQEELSRLRAQVPQKQQTVEWMRAQSATLESLTQRTQQQSTSSELPLLTLVERSANKLDIRQAITRMSPGDQEDQVRIWMDDANFDRWLRWLGALSDSGIEVVEANIDRAQQNRVNIRTTLQR